jgi:hypothetical protein
VLSQAILDSLPSDPEDAFSILEMKLRKGIPLEESQGNYEDQRRHDQLIDELRRQYTITLGAFAKLHGLEIGVDFDELLLLEGSDFDRAFTAASYKIQFFSSMSAFKLDSKRKAGSTCIYVLTDAAKARIRKQISSIKDLIDAAEITDGKRDALFEKLNAFANEVDKDRTRLESLTSAYVAVKSEAKALATVVEPIEKVFDLVSSGGKELWKCLPQVKITARLEAPQKKIEVRKDFDLDDEIPF